MSRRPYGLELDKRITFRLDVDRLSELERIARSEGFSVSVIVRHLVNRFVEDRLRSGGVR